MRRYAEGTRVGISRSRDQIGNLLRTWGAAGVQWTDEYAPDIKVTLRFKWKFEETELLARFTMVCDIKHIEEDSIDGRTGGLSEAKFDKNMAAWQGEAHRLLFLFLPYIVCLVNYHPLLDEILLVFYGDYPCVYKIIEAFFQ